MFFALLFHSVHAFCATIPAGPSVTLIWNPSPDANVVGYDIYHGGASGDYTNMINVGNVTNATIGGLTAGVTYYFAATSYDSLGDQSGFSSEIIYTVPAILPGLQIRAAPAGMFTVTVTGPIGQTYEIQATQDFTGWTVIGTGTVGAGGSLDFTDTNAANFPQRFYRTQETP
ncbi:MAG: fibronectin type III domain-containing protein [Verrucomicrobiota bacterium]